MFDIKHRRMKLELKAPEIMRISIDKWAGMRNWTGLGALGLLLAGPFCSAQTSKIAGDSLKFTPDAAKKELAVGFRLVDDVAVTSVQATADGKDDALPTTWVAWEGAQAPACSWMIVVDTSNPARAKTVAVGVDLIRSILVGMPSQDKVAVYTLARDLTEVVPAGSSPEDVAKGLSSIKVAGDAALTTLIYANLRDSLAKFAGEKNGRKALLLLTDGKDETPGGAEAQEIEKKKLIDAAKSAGVVVHSVGYAESAADQVYFASLKEITAQTDGLFIPSALADKNVPSGSLSLLRGVMHGAGVARVDLSKLTEPVAITLTVKTAAGKTAVLQVAKDKVLEAIPSTAVTPSPDKDKEAADTAAKKVEDDKQAAEKTAKATKDKLAKEKTTAEAKMKKIWIGVGSGVVALLLLALLMVRASRRRAAEEARISEQVRLAEEERMADDARRADVVRKQAEETQKMASPALAWLEMCDAQQTRHPLRLTSLKIGRGQHNDLVLRNDSVSGNHCVLNSSRDGEWTITDLNSGNGVVVNAAPTKQAVLRHGDLIELGELKMRFLLRA